MLKHRKKVFNQLCEFYSLNGSGSASLIMCDFNCPFPIFCSLHVLLICALERYQVYLVLLTPVVMPCAIWKVIFSLSLAEISRFFSPLMRPNSESQYYSKYNHCAITGNSCVLLFH